VQHAQQDSQKARPQETRPSAEPQKGTQADHSSIYSSKRAPWASSAQVKRNKPQAAGTKDHVTEGPQTPPHAAALLSPEDQATFVRLMSIVQSIVSECGKRALTPLEANTALDYLSELKGFNGQCSKNLDQFPVSNTVAVR
jgi:hypothetical protein